MFIDYGSGSWSFFQVFMQHTAVHDRMRFVEHSIDSLRARHGLRNIDVAMPTHAHDDHLNGFPHLARRYGTKVWCYENMVEILENPGGRNLGCVLGEPIRVDRTNFQMARFATIDGRPIAFTARRLLQRLFQPG